MNRLPEPLDLNKNHPQHPEYNDGYVPQVRVPELIDRINPHELMPRVWAGNPEAGYKNPTALKATMDLQHYLFGGGK